MLCSHGGRFCMRLQTETFFQSVRSRNHHTTKCTSHACRSHGHDVFWRFCDFLQKSMKATGISLMVEESFFLISRFFVRVDILLQARKPPHCVSWLRYTPELQRNLMRKHFVIGNVSDALINKLACLFVEQAMRPGRCSPAQFSKQTKDGCKAFQRMCS